MTHIQPQTIPGARYDITKTCELLGIHRNSLRIYTENKDIVAEYHAPTARKLYTAEEIQRFWLSTVKLG